MELYSSTSMSTEHATVSVIMPCFNHGQFVNEAVDSVLAQTYPRLELIIVNDGSTDPETVSLLQSYQKPAVSVIHTSNRGPSAARNTGISQAVGDYILPLDADDRIAPTYLEQAVQILESQPNVGIVYSQAELFGEQTGPFDLPDYNFPEILLGNMIFNSSLFRKADWEKVGGYSEAMIWGWEDYDFWLSIIELGREVVRIPEALYFHREVHNSRGHQMTRDYWVKSYTQIFHNHPRLYGDRIDVIFNQLIQLRDDLGQTQAEINQLNGQINQLNTQLEIQHAHIVRLEAVIASVRRSHFWQWRNRWWKLKQRFGFIVKEDPLLFP